MSRKIKNILMSGLVLVLIVSSCFTVSYAIDNINVRSDMIQNNDRGNPPEMPSGEMGEPPEKPEGEMEEPPEKPDGEVGDNSNGEPPELPDDAGGGEMVTPPDENNLPNMDSRSTSSNNLIIYYLLLSIQSLVLSLILIYLIISEFNKKSFKETFETKDKIIVYVVGVLIWTVGLTLMEVYNIKSNYSNDTYNKLIQNSNSRSETSINNSNVDYNGIVEITKDTEISSGEHSSNKADENVVLVSGDIDVFLKKLKLDKTGDSDEGDNTSFYGMNSAVIAKDGAKLTLKNLTISTDAIGGNGVFSFGGSVATNNSSSDGTVINISNSTITTKKDYSGGIMTTGGGITNASNLTINTSGISSAAIRTDRGGGKVNVDGGTYTTTGKGSPTIYSTAEIIVKNATLIAKKSEGIVVEGKNSVVIENCDLMDNNTELKGSSTTYKNIFLYQSLSGDAETGNSSFTAKNSKITTNNGDSFYITNTISTIDLNNNTIINNDKNGNFLRVKADSWGTKGSNGGDVTLILNNQKAIGNIVVDDISTLDMSMKTNSYYEGMINSDNTAKSLTLKLDKTSTIKLTGDSYITSLNNDVKDNSNINFNGYKLYVNGKAIN